MFFFFAGKLSGCCHQLGIILQIQFWDLFLSEKKKKNIEKNPWALSGFSSPGDSKHSPPKKWPTPSDSGPTRKRAPFVPFFENGKTSVSFNRHFFQELFLGGGSNFCIWNTGIFQNECCLSFFGRSPSRCELLVFEGGFYQRIQSCKDILPETSSNLTWARPVLEADVKGSIIGNALIFQFQNHILSQRPQGGSWIFVAQLLCANCWVLRNFSELCWLLIPNNTREVSKTTKMENDWQCPYPPLKQHSKLENQHVNRTY